MKRGVARPGPSLGSALTPRPAFSGGPSPGATHDASYSNPIVISTALLYDRRSASIRYSVYWRVACIGKIRAIAAPALRLSDHRLSIDKGIGSTRKRSMGASYPSWGDCIHQSNFHF